MQKRKAGKILTLVMAVSLLADPVFAQEQEQETDSYPVGSALSSNAKVYGGIYGAESCSYDPTRGVIVVPNRGAPQNVRTNDAWVYFINHEIGRASCRESVCQYV